MVVANAHIRVIHADGGGFVDGVPVRASEIIGDKVPANVRMTTQRVAKDGDESWRTHESYRILAEGRVAVSPSDKIIVDMWGAAERRATVTDAQYLGLVDMTEIGCEP